MHISSRLPQRPCSCTKEHTDLTPGPYPRPPSPGDCIPVSEPFAVPQAEGGWASMCFCESGIGASAPALLSARLKLHSFFTAAAVVALCSAAMSVAHCSAELATASLLALARLALNSASSLPALPAAALAAPPACACSSPAWKGAGLIGGHSCRNLRLLATQI